MNPSATITEPANQKLCDLVQEFPNCPGNDRADGDCLNEFHTPIILSPRVEVNPFLPSAK